MQSGTYTVTGAFGYSGRYITERLLAAGHAVRTLTNSPERAHPFGDQVTVSPFHFDAPEKLTEALRGTEVLVNTYWVRFSHGDFSHERAVDNTLRLFECAVAAGVRRVVHVSITNPSADSDLPYFRGKARLEEALVATGLPHTILRPAVLFGGEDILVNNIAWMLRRFPVFGIFGDGAYRLQPIHVEDFADLAVEGCGQEGNQVIDAIGPETFSYEELVSAIGECLGFRRAVLHIPPGIGLTASRVMGFFLRDVVITREEIEGLMRGLLYTDSPPAGNTKLTEWARRHAARLGHHYASELARRRNRTVAYGKL